MAKKAQLRVWRGLTGQPSSPEATVPAPSHDALKKAIEQRGVSRATDPLTRKILEQRRGGQ
jgi:hypothetical protein